MLDFVEILTRSPKQGHIEIYPNFVIGKSEDLMTKGQDFYAVWVEDIGLWSTDENDVVKLVDREINQKYEEIKNQFPGYSIKKLLLRNGSSGMIDQWHKYCQKQRRDKFVMLNEKLVFANDPVDKKDYASVRLDYALMPGDYSAWDELVSTLYEPSERHKIEWCIGSIVTGASKTNQKFLVFYGPKGTGKSTIIEIIQKLFKGYYATFDAKALGSGSDSFALEPFKNGPLVAIQHDGNLSRIEDNTRLNSLVSHEIMTVNEKFKSLYANAFKAFLIMGTNDPVRITNAKSGILRRLIDVNPSEHLIPRDRYDMLIQKINFELGAIAWHCKEIYEANPRFYDSYTPLNMMGATNDFYNFVEDSYFVFKKEDSTTLKSAWERYKTYCEDARVPYPLSLRAFKEELKNYFWEFTDRSYTDDGRIRNVYSKFRTDKFDFMDPMDILMEPPPEEEEDAGWLKFNCTKSLLDEFEMDCPAQYATSKETPSMPWDEVTTTLKDIDTSQLHYVKIPETHIVIDFDIPDENGNKCFALNLQEALKWPQTYAELSKSGQGIHLHYVYNGDATMLEQKYADHIEVKVFKNSGKSALRRKLTKCNDIPVATISSGLPLKKGENVVINADAIRSEKGLRNLIARNLRKEIHAGTKPSIDFIKKILDDAYASGLKYDVADMRTAILRFASNSTNHPLYCIGVMNQMKFKSDDPPEVTSPTDDDEIWFYDIEVFPNLLLINFKKRGKGNPMYRLINPKPEDLEVLVKKKLVGFNCRRYDNHIVYAAMMGYSNEEIYNLSKRIIGGDRTAFFSQAYDISYTDIYDFASAGNKKSLKKLEIEMGIHHQELGYDWDKPVPEDKWIEVSNYCDNDVYATEAAFEYKKLKSDFLARQILAELAGGKVNDTTNTLTTKLIFGNDKHPQGQFCYRDLSKPVDYLEPEVEAFLKEACPVMMSKTHVNDGLTFSLLPYFPGYKYEFGKSTYKGVEVGEGGYVYAEPGIYTNVALLDVSSMHPHSAIAECLFGPKFTRVFREIVEGRVSIKHKAWEELNDILGGKLTPFIERVKNGEFTAKDLANALKTAINSVYGLTAAGFENSFRDPRNIDNIVAKRGALFMIDLKEEVERRGFTVAHIKTDSIKIPNATPEIIKFVMDFAQEYGYSFEHEATYDRMCLVNDAVYIAKYATPDRCKELYGYVPGDNAEAAEDGEIWTATGTQFAVPYVFKKLFSGEPVIFDDMCETKSVSKGALYLDMGSEENHDYRFIGRVGQFCPMKNGYDLYVCRDEKYSSPSGTKGYKWMESEYVRANKLEKDIDESYYIQLAENASMEISKYGDFDKFVADEPYPLELTTEYCKKDSMEAEELFMNPPIPA